MINMATTRSMDGSILSSFNVNSRGITILFLLKRKFVF